MPGWQPIATAPQDEARPLLLYPRPLGSLGVPYSAVFEGYWDGRRWRIAGGGMICFPTHWMPMPAPPLTIVNPRG